MFNIGGGEVLVIALIALIAVGPEQLPSVMRKVGGFVGQIRGMTAGLRDEFMSGVDEVKAGVDELDPNNWMGDGSSDSPIVPRGYAENSIKSSAGPSPDGPKVKPPESANGSTPSTGRIEEAADEADAAAGADSEDSSFDEGTE